MGTLPTDTTRTPASSNRPPHGNKSGSNCQDWGSGGFLLLNFESPYRDNLAFSLRLQRIRIIVPEEHGKTYADLTDDEIRDVDYIFCDLTRNVRHDEFRKLQRICNLQRQDGMSILTACWLLKNAQPEFQLMVERLFKARIILCEKPLNP